MTVCITGASSGIGAACARAFAKAGHDLHLLARRAKPLEDLAQEIKASFKVEAKASVLDVQNRRAVEAWTLEKSRELEGVDVLVNNAGLAQGLEPLQEGKLEDWDVMIDTNLKGLLYITRLLLPSLVQNEGHIINIGSVAGRWVYPKGNVYCATKFAVRALNEAMRLDLHGTGVRVTEVAPGVVETPFSETRFKGDKERAAKVYEGWATLKPQDVAETVLWCATRPKHVNVQELVILPTDQAIGQLPSKR